MTYPGNELVCSTLSSITESIHSRTPSQPDIDALNNISSLLASSAELREAIGRSKPTIWPKLHTAWDSLSAIDLTFLAEIQHMDCDALLCVIRFTRNLLPGNSSNQEEILQYEPAIRQLLFKSTAYVSIQNKNTHLISRLLMQTISNLVTGNEPVQDCTWSEYISVPDEANVLVRTLSHPDHRTVIPSLVFILNCISGSLQRIELLVANGMRVCVTLLDLLSKHVDAEEGDAGDEIFELGWNIFKTVFEAGVILPLLSSVAVKDEIVTPHETVLLKILDSYLVQRTNVCDTEQVNTSLTTYLVPKYFDLLNYAIDSIGVSLGTPSSPKARMRADSLEVSVSPGRLHDVSGSNATSGTASLQKLDVLLPKVCEAAVLLTQCLITMALRDENGDPRFQLIRAHHQGSGLVEKLIELLRKLDSFVPRLVLGRTTWSTPRSPDDPAPADIDVSGFNFMKRDLVRLLGILAYNSRAVQDRVRACDGITIVMNLCVTDERNPYLREHALFTLRNLLHDNKENQAVVDAIKPMGYWDENGVLRDMPGTRK